MIVRCERCETRFKLDESRLPARGARVRCSRCKHAFFVTPPGAAKEEVVHEAAAAAARAPAESLRSPEPSWDLEENPDSTVARRKPLASARPGGEAEEDASDWRFEDEVPGLDPGATRSSFDLSGSQTSPSLAAPPDPNEDSFAELGDPETWDLLAGDAPPTAPAPTPAQAEPAPSPAPAASVASERAASAATPVASATPAGEPRPVPAPAARARLSPPASRTAFAPPPVVMPRRIPAASRSLSAQMWGGWAAVVALAAVVAWASLAPAGSSATEASLAPVSGFEVREARARVVENAAAGPILVVSGRLRNPGPSVRPLGAPLAVQLLDAQGEPLAGGAGAAGPALPEQRVREDAPERLVASQDEAATLASAPVAAGAELEFSAVFAPAPRDARRFVLSAGASR